MKIETLVWKGDKKNRTLKELELISCEFITFTTEDVTTPLCERTGYECMCYKNHKNCKYRDH